MFTIGIFWSSKGEKIVPLWSSISQNCALTWSKARLEIAHQNLHFQPLFTKLLKSVEEKISFSNIWLVFGKIRVEIFIISHFMKSHFSKVCWNQTFALNKIVNHWYVLKLQGRENSSSLKLNFSKFCSDLKSDKVGNCSPELEFSDPTFKTFLYFSRKKFILHCKKAVIRHHKSWNNSEMRALRTKWLK